MNTQTVITTAKLLLLCLGFLCHLPALANDELNKGLIEAIKRKNLNRVNELLATGADVNIQDNNGNTALIEATLNLKLDIEKTPADIDKNRDIIKALIAAGANVNIQNNQGSTALIWASSAGDLEIVKRLLAAGANVNIQTNGGYTALAAAISTERLGMKEANLNVIIALLAAGAELPEDISNARMKKLVNKLREQEINDELKHRGIGATLEDESRK